MNILVINPGSTSTKVSFFINEENQKTVNYPHTREELAVYPTINTQIEFRKSIIFQFLAENEIKPESLDVVVGRGGILPPVKSGAYEINQRMIDYLLSATKIEHPSNLGAILAEEVRKSANKKTRALIYDPVSVDEFSEVARISGLKGVPRQSIGHALNMRAVAMKTAVDYHSDYKSLNMIVAHLGGGNSISIHEKGRMIDSISDDEGPFSTERTGGLPLKHVIHLCASHTEKEMLQLYKRAGGLLSYAGTNDARKVEQRIADGDKNLQIVYEALAYQIAKGIGSLATVVEGKVDFIVLTGGLSYSEYIVEEIKRRTAFIAPIKIEKGEHEMQALASGAYRVLSGKEQAREFD
ncbi:butyrate kinase [Enterococcus phoeniculicola]|jgi:butyrate kinase|uniref:Probable butyrate kinase n=1 Tax=Enterococcus phoeniculicola ATCC BAA-412 TaxID=1158610 RepID=R3WWE2_9ENTE|nr:butyrate kinase [Enterococcus phoeniculicola]EOL46095.1 butyrate kinase [Enterococcus phoeniculicola ATCC BAA-412]EOT77060.1 butyrate kinase [Enterococcus phoeniculicola ATCC BAA-412]